jgi:hypothetical protein
MPEIPRQPKIYHITHIDNLHSIVAAEGLWCDARRVEYGFAHRNIAYRHIKESRMARPVPVSAQGTLADYVPFYFAPRSPMLYAINKGLVKDCPDGQKPVLHLVASVEAATTCGRQWCFTDRHAVLGIAKFHDDHDDLDEIDWPLMQSKFWHNIDADPTRKERRQAEFLVYQSFPWSCIHKIGVYNKGIAQTVETIISQAAHKPDVCVEPKWYY